MGSEPGGCSRGGPAPGEANHRPQSLQGGDGERLLLQSRGFAGRTTPNLGSLLLPTPPWWLLSMMATPSTARARYQLLPETGTF